MTTTEASVLDPGDDPQVDRRAQLERTKRNDRGQASVAAALPPERRQQIKKMIRCPKCQSKPGEVCRREGGRATDMHVDRIMAAIRRSDFKW
jgi:hypothetical protein